MNRDFDELRREYGFGGLTEEQAPDTPWPLFRQWFQEAKEAPEFEPNAMCLATLDPDGAPSNRIVLMKGLDDGGPWFFTNYESRKGMALAHDPRAALTFWWPKRERQVRMEGQAHRLDAAASDSYFRSRPRDSQLGAWCSPQSEVLASRSELERRANELESRFEGRDPERPPFWGGYRFHAFRIEFWQGRRSRLHDRLRYTRTPSNSWTRERLAP